MIQDNGLTCPLKKCNFISQRVNYLGHVVTAEWLERQLEKNKTMENMQWPWTKCQEHQFWGTCEYCRSFKPHFEKKKTAPLNDLLNKNKSFKWTAEEENESQTIKNVVCHAPYLAHLDSQWKTSWCFPHKNVASDLGLETVLFQEREGDGRDIIKYASHKKLLQCIEGRVSSSLGTW